MNDDNNQPEAPVTLPWSAYRQELFRVLGEHGFTALESEMDEIEHIVLSYHGADLDGYRNERDYLDRLLTVVGEHSLPESAENRVREIAELRAKVTQLREALEYCGCHEHTESPCDESGSHYRNLCEFCKKIDDALVISTTDSVWLKPLRNTLGLLRAARGYLPGVEVSGTLRIQLDREIERLEKLVPPEAPDEERRDNLLPEPVDGQASNCLPE